MLTRWRQRRLYQQVMANEVRRVRPVVDEVATAISEAANDARKELDEIAEELLGYLPRCHRCGELLELARIPYKPYRARKTRWRTAYRCPGCRSEYAVVDVRAGAAGRSR